MEMRSGALVANICIQCHTSDTATQAKHSTDTFCRYLALVYLFIVCFSYTPSTVLLAKQDQVGQIRYTPITT